MLAEKSSFERAVVVGSCPAERQDAVMAAASLQPNLTIGFVKDAVLTKGKSVEEWEAHVVGQAVALQIALQNPRQLPSAEAEELHVTLRNGRNDGGHGGGVGTAKAVDRLLVRVVRRLRPREARVLLVGVGVHRDERACKFYEVENKCPS